MFPANKKLELGRPFLDHGFRPGGYRSLIAMASSNRRASWSYARAPGKAPEHVDVTALHHTEIVYRSVAEIRQELINRGVPEVLLEYSSKDSNDK